MARSDSPDVLIELECIKSTRRFTAGKKYKFHEVAAKVFIDSGYFKPITPELEIKDPTDGD